jgi:L-alanine-DL-glutamate epimerase-like enolase superfamily enzyme
MKITRVEPFQVEWGEPGQKTSRSAFVRIETEDGRFGLGEASPMEGGLASLVIIARHMAPFLVGKDVLDHAVLLETLLHRLVKLGPEGALSGALAALDIALWDLKGKLLGRPVHKLLGGAWRTNLTCYASIGGNAWRTVDEVVQIVERRVAKEKPAAVKIRWDGNRTAVDVDIPGDIAKAKAVRKALGDGFMLGFDANNGYSIGGAMRVGRALEELGYAWFEEPVQHYHVAAMGEVAQRLDITVSAGEQTYTLQGVKDLINAGVRMVQPDITKMGGITGMMQCAALAHAHGVELVPHQTQPSIGQLANLHLLSTIMHLAKPVELADNWERVGSVFRNPSEPVEGLFTLPTAPGLGMEFDAAELQRRSRPLTI